MDVELPDGTVVEGVPDGMSQRDLVSLLSKNGHDTSWYKDPKPGVLDRIKSALTPDPNRAPMPSTADTINEPWTNPQERGVVLPGSVMDGFVPPEADPNRGASSPNVGPMREDYYQSTRAWLLSAPLQTHSAAAQAGGQVGKVARDTLSQRVDRAERIAAGDTLPKTQQEFSDDTTGRAPLAFERAKERGRETLDLFKPQVIAEIQRTKQLSPEDAAAEFEAMRKYGVDPTDILQGRKEAGWGEVVSSVIGSTPKRTENWMANFSRMVFDSLGADAGSSAMARVAEETRKELEKQNASIGRIPADSWKETFASALPSALDNLGGMTAAAVATIIARNPAILIGSMDTFVLAPMFMQKSGLSYEEGLKAGMQPNKAMIYGMANGFSEVIPERLNFGMIARAGEQAAKGIMRGAAANYMKANATEVAEEVITAVADHMIDLGMKDPNKSVEELWKDVKQSSLGVMMTMPLIMGGNAAAIGGYRFADAAGRKIKASRDLTYGMGYDSAAIDAAARQALNPDNAQLSRSGGLLTAPVVPRATPADVASAQTPQAAAEAIADIGAAMAPAVTEAIAATQSEIDALLTDPISSQPTGALDAQAQEAVTPEARPQAPAAAVTDFIAQGENGRWALSRPMDGQPPEMVSAIIDELDRRNSAGAPAGQGVAQPSREESDQERSYREWTENYDRVSITDDLSTVSTTDLRRAMSWASKRSQSEKRKGWDGGEVNSNITTALDAEELRIRTELKRRGDIQADPAPAGAQQTTGGQDGQRQETAEVLTEPAAANPVSAAAERFDPKGLKPGTPEYEAAFDSWSSEQQDARRKAELEQRRVAGQSAVDKKNAWRKRLISWFESAKDGDALTTDMGGEELRVVETTIKRNGKEIASKRLVEIGANGEGKDRTIIEYRDGNVYQGPNTKQGVDEFSGWAQAPETEVDSRAASIGKLLEDGVAKVRASSAAAASQEAKLQAQYQAAATEANDPRLTDGERKLAEAKADAALDALGEVTQGAEKSITRIKGGKLAITGFTREDVSESLKTAKIAALVTAGADGKVLVSATDRAGNQVELTIKQQNAINAALMGAQPKKAKTRTYTGNLRNDVNLIAPGLYAEVARGGDGEGMDIDLSLVAERLRDEGFMLPTVETGKDSDAVIELIRQDLANGGGTLNERRGTEAMEQDEARKAREEALRLADEYGIPVRNNGAMWRKTDEILDDLERAITHEIGIAGRAVVEITKDGVDAGAFTNAEAKNLELDVASGYRGDQARDAKVRMYREIANLLQDKINEYESNQPAENGEVDRGPGESAGVAQEDRPALELAGQSEAEIRDEEARIAAAKEAEEAEAREAEEQARREKAERDKADMQKRLENQPFEFGVGAKEAKKPQRDIFSSPVDAAAHEAATSPTNDKPAPTPGQMEAGNYAKGHIRLHGFDISIENPKGSERVAKDGSWRVPSMPAHYGYIKGTVGADKDHLDVFIGPNPESSTAWVINQVVADSSPAKFDEHKVMIGFDSADEAKKAYLDSFEKGYGARVFGSMTGALTIDELKAKIESGELSRKKFVGPVEGGTDAQREKQGYNEPAGPVAPIANETASSEAVSLSEVLKLAEGKTVSRQVVIAETGQTMTLNNQDAVATIKQINSDIQALEALRLCIGG